MMRAALDPGFPKRLLLSIGVLAPVVGMLCGGAWHAARGGSVAEMGCWLLPKGQVMTHPGSSTCPLRLLEAIRRVESRGHERPVEDARGVRALLESAGASIRVAVQRVGAETWVSVPVARSTSTTRTARVAVSAIAAVLLLSIPLFLLWRSDSPAAVPLTLFYGSVSIVLTAMLCGQHSANMTRAAVGALILAPGALTHLAFTFPRERALLREIPRLAVVPYGAVLVLVPIGWVAIERDPLLGPAFLGLVLVLGSGAWSVLLFACGLALRESDSPMERARARLVFFGALLAPLVPTLFAAPGTASPALLVVFYLWSAAALMPLPIALAISRYNLFDLGWDIRHAIVRTVYLGLAALVVSLVFASVRRFVGTFEQFEAAPLYLVSFVCVLAIEPLRNRMPGLLEAVMEPRLRQLRLAREGFASAVSSLQDEDAISRHLGSALRSGVRARFGCVFLHTGGNWRPAYPFGRCSRSWAELLDESLDALGDASLLHLPADPERESRARGLKMARVEMICSIESGRERYGVILAGSARTRAPYTGMEVDFVRTVSEHAAIALRNARITAEMVAAERNATTGRLAIGLAHDLGKDLAWIRGLARRLPQRFEDETRLARDASMIRELSDGLAEAVERFVRESGEPAPGQSLDSLELLVDRAIRRVGRTHGRDRVTKNLDPQLARRRFHEHLERVIGNLLDNALHASPSDATVHLFGTLEGDVVHITISDRGSGIPPALADRVFEAGVGTRLENGGSGVGLTVAREIVEGLGGTLLLEPGSECGTRASIRVPLQRKGR